VSGSELAAAFGLASAASWGGGDFSGGLAARRANAFVVAGVSRAVGLSVQVGLALAVLEPAPPIRAVAWGIAAGVAGSIGLAALYRSLAIGRMGINSPLTAVLAAALPVLVAALSQGLPSGVRVVGFGLALAGVWCLSRPEGVSGAPRGLGLALLAGLGFGGFYVLIAQVRGASVFWPLTASTGTSFIVLLALALAGRRAWFAAPGALPISLLAGALDAGGNIFFVLAAHGGRLDVAAVLASLYPAVTVLMARLILKEHLNRLQAVGIGATLAAIPLIVA
jgi:drug/metabolite transporter (DMT)-like permease